MPGGQLLRDPKFSDHNDNPSLKNMRSWTAVGIFETLQYGEWPQNWRELRVLSKLIRVFFTSYSCRGEKAYIVLKKTTIAIQSIRS